MSYGCRSFSISWLSGMITGLEKALQNWYLVEQWIAAGQADPHPALVILQNKLQVAKARRRTTINICLPLWFIISVAIIHFTHGDQGAREVVIFPMIIAFVIVVALPILLCNEVSVQGPGHGEEAPAIDFWSFYKRVSSLCEQDPHRWNVIAKWECEKRQLNLPTIIANICEEMKAS